MDLNIGGECGCGKPTKYSTFCGRGSCNKYQRCLSYKELNSLCKTLKEENLTYRFYLDKIVGINATDYEYKSWAKEGLDKVIIDRCNREREIYNHNLMMIMED